MLNHGMGDACKRIEESALECSSGTITTEDDLISPGRLRSVSLSGSSKGSNPIRSGEGGGGTRSRGRTGGSQEVT